MLHATAEIENGAQIGEGTDIWRYSCIRESAVIGSNCIIGQGVYIDCNVRIGDYCKIENGVQIFRGAILKDGVFVGPNATFTNVRNPRARIDRKHMICGICVCENATIGANATLLPGIIIGKSAFVGAGAVVTKSVPAFTVVVGNPARYYSYVCSCGNIHKAGFVCSYSK